MGKKEIMDRINKVENKLVRDMLTESFSKASPQEIRKTGRMIESYENKVKNDLNFRAKAIAAYIRSNIEDFHAKHLSDKQMKELNPLIRNAVYTFLKDDADNNFFKISGTCACNLASYWEDCEYVKQEHVDENELEEAFAEAEAK
jgi:hypothetical protein